MTRNKQAIKFAIDTYANKIDSRFKDKEWRIKWYEQAREIEKQMFMMTLEALAMQDLDRVEWVETL